MYRRAHIREITQCCSKVVIHFARQTRDTQTSHLTTTTATVNGGVVRDTMVRLSACVDDGYNDTIYIIEWSG